MSRIGSDILSPSKDVAVSFTTRLLGLLFPRRTPPPDFNPRSIVIIKPCCLGDVLMATATLGALRARFPAAHIAWVVGSWSRPVVTTNPKLNELIDGDGLGVGGAFRWASYLSLVRILRRRSFDLALVLDRSPRLTLLPWLAGIPVRAGLDSLGRGFSLTVRVPCPEDRHEAQIYLDVARALGIPVEGATLEFFPTADEMAWAEAVLRQAQDAMGDGPLAAVHPGGGVNPGTSLLAKRWPADGFAAVIARLLKQGVRVALLGGPSDEETVDQVRAQLPATDGGLLDFSGQLSIGQMGALLRRCRLFLGNDSGPLHLAVAVGTPVVGLYGPTNPANIGPFEGRSTVLYRGESCSPCFVRGRGPEQPCDQHCLTAISTEEVWQAIERLLNQE